MKPAKKSYPSYTLNENTRFSDITSAAGSGGQKHHISTTEESNKTPEISMLIELVRQSAELMSRFIRAFYKVKNDCMVRLILKISEIQNLFDIQYLILREPKKLQDGYQKIYRCDEENDCVKTL